jgi:hypothetical protein
MERWSLDRVTLDSSLSRFHATRPDTSTLRNLNEWIMDVLAEPLAGSSEDPDHPGIFTGRVPGTNVEVTFVLDLAKRVIHITDISATGSTGP